MASGPTLKGGLLATHYSEGIDSEGLKVFLNKATKAGSSSGAQSQSSVTPT